VYSVRLLDKQRKTWLVNVQTLANRKEIVNQFFQLVSQGRMKEGLRFFTPDAKQHNPYLHGGMDVLLESMASAFKEGSANYPEPDFKLVNMVADGDVVIVQTQLLGNRSKPEQGGLRQAHIFRFKGDKIAEYCDITQTITPDMPNPKNAF
jgi:predicted SnoaL-like aldol condensation-catalyzing enzyme